MSEWSSVLPKDGNVFIYYVHSGSVSNRVLDELQKKEVPAKFIEGSIEAWKVIGNKSNVK